MKAEIYNALSALNSGFDLVFESLTILQQAEVIPANYVQDHTALVEELRAGLNHMILEKLHTREIKDWGPSANGGPPLRRGSSRRLNGLGWTS